MSRPSALGYVRYEAESTFGEDTSTFATRLPVLDSVDVSGLEQSMLEPGRVVQHLQGGTKRIPGPMGGAFKVRVHLAGHGSTAASTVSATSVPTLLGYVLGGVAREDGTTATGGTAATPTVSASGTFGAGHLARLGALGDGRGGGFFAPVDSHSGNNLALSIAAPAGLNNGDVVYGSETVYMQELVDTSTSAAVTGLRFLLGSPNLTYECHGCYPRSVSFSGLANGEIPTAEIEFGCSWFKLNNSITFPVSTSVETFTPAPSAAGNAVLAATGATTRTVITMRSLALNVTLGIAEIRGTGGVNVYQTIIGCTRTPSQVSLSIGLDLETDATDNQFLNWLTNASKQFLYTLNVQDGAAMGMYCPNMVWSGNRPVRRDDNGINRQTLDFMAHANTSGSADLYLSALRMAFA